MTAATPVFASAGEAMAMVHAGLAFIATADATAITSQAIAARRVSRDGQEGLRAFLEKRAPAWK